MASSNSVYLPQEIASWQRGLEQQQADLEQRLSRQVQAAIEGATQSIHLQEELDRDHALRSLEDRLSGQLRSVACIEDKVMGQLKSVTRFFGADSYLLSAEKTSSDGGGSISSSKADLLDAPDHVSALQQIVDKELQALRDKIGNETSQRLLSSAATSSELKQIRANVDTFCRSDADFAAMEGRLRQEIADASRRSDTGISDAIRLVSRTSSTSAAQSPPQMGIQNEDFHALTRGLSALQDEIAQEQSDRELGHRSLRDNFTQLATGVGEKLAELQDLLHQEGDARAAEFEAYEIRFGEAMQQSQSPQAILALEARLQSEMAQSCNLVAEKAVAGNLRLQAELKEAIARSLAEAKVAQASSEATASERASGSEARLDDINSFLLQEKAAREQEDGKLRAGIEGSEARMVEVVREQVLAQGSLEQTRGSDAGAELEQFMQRQTHILEEHRDNLTSSFEALEAKVQTDIDHVRTLFSQHLEAIDAQREQAQDRERQDRSAQEEHQGAIQSALEAALEDLEIKMKERIDSVSSRAGGSPAVIEASEGGQSGEAGEANEAYTGHLRSDILHLRDRIDEHEATCAARANGFDEQLALERASHGHLQTALEAALEDLELTLGERVARVCQENLGQAGFAPSEVDTHHAASAALVDPRLREDIDHVKGLIAQHQVVLDNHSSIQDHLQQEQARLSQGPRGNVEDLEKRVRDLCRSLEGVPAAGASEEIAALQASLAALDARLAPLEGARRMPFAVAPPALSRSALEQTQLLGGLRTALPPSPGAVIRSAPSPGASFTVPSRPPDPQ